MKNRLFFDIKSDVAVFDEILKERGKIDYYSLPEQNLSDLKNYKREFELKNRDIEYLVVIGIGGSSLGLKAIYKTLLHVKDFSKEICFLESTDPVALKSELGKLDLKKSHFFVISKSGTTIETISIYKYILSLLKDKQIDLRYRFTFITGTNTPLEAHSKSLDSFLLHIPKSVGGRFSVLSNVALAPLSLIEVDIKSLLNGAKRVKESFFKNGYLKSILLKKATYYAKNSMKYNINSLFIYSESFSCFGEWYIQLWGESLGKKQLNSSFNVGLTPISLIGPKDQHSFLQLIVDGLRDKSVTFLKIENFNQDFKIPDIKLKGFDGLENLDSISFNTLINIQADSIIEALLSKRDIPVDIITLNRIDEYSLGEFIFYYELLTSLVAKLIGVDAYNQPGVEESKNILLKKLGEIKK